MSDQKPSGILGKEMTRKEFLVFGGVAIGATFGLVGVIKQLTSHAATATASVEPESSTPASPATTVTDTTASGNKAVKFNAPVVPVDTFVLGETEPDDSNSGVGVIRPAPTTVINGNVTVAAGQTVADKIINGYVDIAMGGTLENCIVRGPAVEPTAGRPIVRVPNGTITPGGTRANIRFCEIRPQTPSAYSDGIGYKGYHAYRCKIQDTTDGFAAFSTTADGLINILIQGCYSPNMVQWRPDYAYPGGRSHTHNDTIQFQGNLGDENDAVLEGNSFNARFVTYAGTQPLQSPAQQVAAVMITPGPNVQIRVSATFRKNWFRGGAYCINGGSDNNTSGLVVFTGNRFERPGSGTGAPAAALVLNPAYPRTVSGNTYIDNGQAVPVTNG